MINVSVTGLQEAQSALRKEIEKLVADKKSVLVGIHDDAGDVDGGDLTMAKLGAILHFGADIDHPGGTSYGYKTKKDQETGRVSFLKKGAGVLEIGVTKPHKIKIPPRPWLDVGVKTGVKDYVSILKDNGDDLDNALNLIGLTAVGKVQQYMTELKSPPNAKSTIRKKKSANPLINNGALRQSVTYSITSEEVREGLE